MKVYQDVVILVEKCLVTQHQSCNVEILVPRCWIRTAALVEAAFGDE